MSKDKESICVTVRVRPLSSKQLDEDSRICLKVEQETNKISMNGMNGEKESKDYYFDSVCDRISQMQMFLRAGKKSTKYCMEGYNCTIFAYGQTGAGKTFTMMGVNPESKDYHDLRGLIPRTLQHLFDEIQREINETGVEYMIKCSFVEIYNEQIIDLMGNNTTLNIRQDMKKGVYIEGVTEQTISRSEDALEILRKGSKGRHVGSTFYNQTSSRSHSVFTMQIDSQRMNNGIKTTKSRHFHFIDLAGSERTKKSIGDRLKEGCSINKSLHVLSTVIGSLAEASEGKTRHINYRDSKLTFLLKDSLGGNSKTHVIANISPSWISVQQTKSTLIFARKVKMIKMSKVSINEDSSGNLQSLKTEIKRLKSEVILLKNGAPNYPSQPLTTNDQSSQNSKMMNVLQQYIGEQLDKQTQLQLQMNKLTNKNIYLQKGLTNYSENEKQLRMILAIYEEKVKRFKKIEEKLFEQLDNRQFLEEYFCLERNSLLEEIEKLKKIGSSTVLVKNLMRDLKMLKEEHSEQVNIVELIDKNNQFLKQIQSSIKQLQPQYKQANTDVKLSNSSLEELQTLKQEKQNLTEEVQKKNIQISEIKEKLEQSEILLEEAITTQINLQSNIKQHAQQKTQIQENYQKSIQEYANKLTEMKQKEKSMLCAQNQLEMKNSQYQIQMSEIKKDFMVMKEKNKYEENNYQVKIDNLEAQKINLQQLNKQKQQEIKTLKMQIISHKNQYTQKIDLLTQQICEQNTKINEFQLIFSQFEEEKKENKLKLQAQRQNYQLKIEQKQHNLQNFQQKHTQQTEQIKILQQQLLKQGKITVSWKQKYQTFAKQYQGQKQKWDQLHKELVSMINEKQESDSETHKKLTQSQLELIQMNQKIICLTSQNQLIEQTSRKQIEELSQKISQLTLQINQNKQSMSKYQKNLTELKNKGKQVEQKLYEKSLQSENLAQKLSQSQQQYNKLKEETLKLKQKQKELRIGMNQQKNEKFALKKNYDIQLQSAKQIIKRKEEELSHQQQQYAKKQSNWQKKLEEIQKLMENQTQVLMQNQLSIKKAMEEHLKSKQKRISELNKLKIQNEQKLIKLNVRIQNLLEQLKEKQEQLTKTEQKLNLINSQYEQSQKQKQQIKNKLQEVEVQHFKQIEEMQNNFNEQIDEKNAQIQKYQIQLTKVQQQLKKIQILNHQNNILKKQIQEFEKKCENMEKLCKSQNEEISELKKLYSQSEHQCGHLQSVLVQKDRQIFQLQTNIKSKSSQNKQINQELSQKFKIASIETESYQNQIVQLKKKLQELQIQLSQNKQQFHKINSQMLEKQTLNQQKAQQLMITLKIFQNQKIQLIEKLEGFQQREQILSKQFVLIQNSFSTDTSQQKGEEINSEKFVYHIKNKLCELSQMLKHEKQANLSLVQKIQEKQILFQSKINEKQQQNLTISQQNLNLKNHNHKISQKLEQNTEQLKNCEQQIQKFTNIISTFSETKNKFDNDTLTMKQQLQQLHEQKSAQIFNLNKLYQKLKEEKDQLLQQLENVRSNGKMLEEIVRKFQEEISEKKQQNQDLQKFIEQQNSKIIREEQYKQELKRCLQQMKIQHENILKQERNKYQTIQQKYQNISEQLTKIQKEMNNCKQKSEELENDLKISVERNEKYRKEYYRERQSNKQFKQLLENAHNQIENFKSQAHEKDKLYHQLLDKVSKNQVERKGILSQDRKISQLLEKSRLEINQYRKKYDDQLKINNLLKQEIQKKQIQCSIVKEKSQQYIKNQQHIYNEVKADYAKLQANYKKKEVELTETYKCIQNSNTKINEFEIRYEQVLQQCRNAQKLNEEIKKQNLKSGSDERQILFINKLKEENMQFKRKIERMEEDYERNQGELLRMKSQRKYNKEGEVSLAEFNKKNLQVKYLQKQFDQLAIVFPTIDFGNKKSVVDGIKTEIQQLQRQLTKTKGQNIDLKEQSKSNRQKIAILENPKSRNFIEQSGDTLSKFRSRIGKSTSTFENLRQSKQEQKSVLNLKDPNRGHWGYGK